MWLIYPEIRDFQILITKTVFHEASLATKFAQVICDQIQFSNFSTEQKKLPTWWCQVFRTTPFLPQWDLGF